MSKSPKDKISKILVVICIVGSICVVVGLALIISHAQVPAMLTFVMLFGGFALCFGSGIWMFTRTVNQFSKKENPRQGRLTTNFTVPKNTEKGVYNGTKTNVANTAVKRYVSKYDHYGDITVVPIEYGKEWWEESENCLKNLLDNVKYPEGFEEFLKEYGQCEPNDLKWKKAKRIFINENIDDDKKYYVDKYFELDEVDNTETLRQTNENILLSCEFYAQFRNILVFASDASGESFFFLDYGKGGEPSVKYFADGVAVYLLANSFKEFKDKLVTAKEAAAILGDEYYGDIND